MKKKVILRYILSVILFLGVLLGFALAKDFQEEKKLENELVEIETLVNQYYFNDIFFQRKMETYVTTGDYRIVEKAIKDFYSEVYTCYSEINDIVSDQNIVNLVSYSNYRSDGPLFIQSFTYIENYLERLEELKKQDEILFTEDHIMSYIKDKDLHSYYIDYYKELMLGDDEVLRNDNVGEELEDTIDVLNKIKNILQFLADNKNGWKLASGSISFATEDLENEYMRLVNILIYDEGSSQL